ncbi:membrane protein [Portibacter lacus]|uniref:Membrane protein n=2 Tax=Portibacter lacus TaxID=1099794 RepID=A0AA37WHW6_9BACT|nr:membrane protein [Portibacter lacus]
MLCVGFTSAFISTTAVVIVFIKMISELHAQGKLEHIKYLLPISFAGIVGGSATLMGTSTNLIVNEIAERRGIDSLRFFEFTDMGFVFMAITIVVVTILVRVVIKSSDKKAVSEDYNLEQFVTLIGLVEDSPFIDTKIKDIPVFDNEDISILSIGQFNSGSFKPSKYYRLQKDDKIVIRATVEMLAKLQDQSDFTILESDKNTAIASNENKNFEFYEVIVMPGSDVIGRSLRTVTRLLGEKAKPIAIKKHKSILQRKFRIVNDLKSKVRIEVGDRILLYADKFKLKDLQEEQSLLLFEEFSDLSNTSVFKRNFSIAVLLLVVILAATGVCNILLSTLIGSFLMLFSGATELSSAYKAINWPIIFLLAGMIPIGVAMSNTGADDWLINQLMLIFSTFTPTVVLACLFLFTMLMSGVVSNNATAIIMTPIAIALAVKLDVDPKAFILAIMFSANFSFFTPIGYQTNTIIYGMGLYRFKHFLIIGGVLSLLLWIASVIMLKMRYL